MGETITRCGAFEVVAFGGVDFANDSYYDVSTGKLVAVVVNDVTNTLTCVAGPSTFTPPSDCGLSAKDWSACGPADAGIDASPDTGD